MSKRLFKICLVVLTVMLLCGCSMRTTDEMYAFPKRSKAYKNLQSVIDSAMTGLQYCAPLSGENQQTVQMADLDGDGQQEYLLFAKGSEGMPLRILIFYEKNGAYEHTETIESNGSSFDLIEYVQMDDLPGVEMIVGKQVSDQVLRSVSVYSFNTGKAELLTSVNYSKFLTTDMDRDGNSELFVLWPGQTETDNGIVALYRIRDGVLERSNEASMSRPSDQLKRIIFGRLHSGESAVYAASIVDSTAIVTDVYAMVGDTLTNVTFSNESGTSVQTIRNYYVYADDIDDDGVVELPDLIPMTPMDDLVSVDRQDLIRWYAMTAKGEEVDKKYTYHDFVSGWYLELDKEWASRVAVRNLGYQYDFYVWDVNLQIVDKIASVYILSGTNRDEQTTGEQRFVLHKTDSVTYMGCLWEDAGKYNIDSDDLISRFHLIQHDWKTGET